MPPCSPSRSLIAARWARLGLGDPPSVAPAVATCYVLFRCAHAAEAADVLATLAASNVETRLWYGHGLHRQPYFTGLSRDDLAVTERVAPLAIGLPIAPDLPDACIQRVVTAVVRNTVGYC